MTNDDTKINNMHDIELYNFTNKTYLIVALSLRIILKNRNNSEFQNFNGKIICYNNVQLFGLCVIPCPQYIIFIVVLLSNIHLISSEWSLSFRLFTEYFIGMFFF